MEDGKSSAQAATRDYLLTFVQKFGEAPLLNVRGGKLTTYRKLAEAALKQLGEAIGEKGKEWTADKPLPGGDFPVTGFDDLVARVQEKYSFLDPRHARRLTRLYGTKAFVLLGDATNSSALGTLFGDDLYQIEIDYLIAHELALTSEDVLWRRTKKGLWLSAEQADDVKFYMRQNSAVAASYAAR